MSSQNVAPERQSESYEVSNVERKVPYRLVLDPSTALKNRCFYFDSSVTTRKYGEIGKGPTYRQAKPGKNPKVVCTPQEFSKFNVFVSRNP
jgi:hypothetical protein